MILDLLQESQYPEIDNLKDWLLVSELNEGVVSEAGIQPLAQATDADLTVRVARAEGQKCERCWHYETDIGQHKAHPTLCGRCVAVLEA
jgi:isoleucyl-tRNA synthetase